MCILCMIQKWSRRVATMLPWLVIPLIGLWGLSQMLPPPYRFEVTSTRLACVFVLLVTLFWYEVLMPWLSAWRVRRNAHLRERRRFEALQLQKLRKTATRRCRNCLTPYRDQNPGGGKFMCSYCGHISKRPVLDLPIPPGLGISNSGIIKDLFGKTGKILNGREWSDDGSICHDWLDQDSWVVSSSFAGNSAHSRENDVSFYGGSEQHVNEKPYVHAYFSPHIWMPSFSKNIRWLWRKLFRVSSPRDNVLLGSNRGILVKRSDNGVSFQESRGEKARRKAEEKRQARLEKEHLEEEERKQREEVARLVEERRRLRDEKMEAENRARGSCQREKDKKEAERRRQDRRKEKDKASSKSNSDVEEMEKKLAKETDGKQDTDKKAESERREPLKIRMDTSKGQGVESGHGFKGDAANAFGGGNAGVGYFDRMRGTIFSSSKAFTSGSFFSKVSRAPVSKDKANGCMDHFQDSANKRDFCSLGHAPTKPATNGDDKATNRLQVSSGPQHRTTPKSWQQLFTQSPAVSAPSNANVIGRPIMKPQAEAQNSQLHSRSSSPPTYDNPIDFAFSLPLPLPTLPSGSMSNSFGLPIVKDHMIPHVDEVPRDVLPEEPELFVDPRYIADPVSLLGPVSESLDNFQLDLGTGFVPDEMEKPLPLSNRASPLDTNRQSPIKSSISRVRVDEMQSHPSGLSTSPRAQDVLPFPAGHFNGVNEKGTWQMWNSTPLVQDGLGYAGSHANWIPSLNWRGSYTEDILHPAPQKTMASLFMKDNQVVSGTDSFQKIFLGNGQNGVFEGSVSSPNDDLWLQKTFSPPLSANKDQFLIKHTEDLSQKKMVYGSPPRPGATFDASPANYWSRNEWLMQGSGEGMGKSSGVKPNVGGLCSTPDVKPFGHLNEEKRNDLNK